MEKGLLERLKDGIVLGDGGYVWALEKRGYVKAGPWTPEAVIENPDGVRQLHREFLRAGSNVLQAFTFHSSEDRLSLSHLSAELSCKAINDAACKIALQVANEGHPKAMVAGSIARNPAYKEGKGKKYVQNSVREQCEVFLKHKLDFIICEFFSSIEEMEWAIEEAKKTGIPVMSTMCIGLEGDDNGVSTGECGVRMAKANADVVGLNCRFGPIMTLEAMNELKKGLDKEGLKPILAIQANGFFTTDMGKNGYDECPEYPFAMETREITRFDVHKYARKAYEMGVRYIGGCCGFEPYHIRAIAEELSPECGGYMPPASAKHAPWGGALREHKNPQVQKRGKREYWENLMPASGRPTSK